LNFKKTNVNAANVATTKQHYYYLPLVEYSNKVINNGTIDFIISLKKINKCVCLSTIFLFSNTAKILHSQIPKKIKGKLFTFG